MPFGAVLSRGRGPLAPDRASFGVGFLLLVQFERFAGFDACPVGFHVNDSALRVFRGILEWFRCARAAGCAFDIFRAVVATLGAESVNAVVG